ncbi:MAG TPA: hypothetical protein VD905_02915 [Flavobacteriales bacterium]|nr:hypothetical protein [Flavobacteriales bacterium]
MTQMVMMITNLNKCTILAQVLTSVICVPFYYVNIMPERVYNDHMAENSYI